MSCLDDVALEKVLLDAPAADDAQHLAGCASCTARLEAMRAEDRAFKQFVYPATVDAVLAGALARPWWRSWPALVLPLAVAAGVALLVRTPVEAPADYVGLKGRSVGLAVFSLDSAGAPVRLDDGARLAADASLRFQVRPDAPCFLWVVSVDPQGEVSRLFPAVGESSRVAGDTTLPGGATLDGQSGPERVFAVCTPAPLAFDAIRDAVRVTSADAVRARRQLELDGAQGTLLLEKMP
jgi:hypothetical protein